MKKKGSVIDWHRAASTDLAANVVGGSWQPGTLIRPIAAAVMSEISRRDDSDPGASGIFPFSLYYIRITDRRSFRMHTAVLVAKVEYALMAHNATA